MAERRHRRMTSSSCTGMLDPSFLRRRTRLAAIAARRLWMNKRKWLQGAGVLSAAWMLAGCVNLGLREPVQVNVVGIEPLPGEGMEMRMAVKLRLQNPNDVAMDFDGISIVLDVRGSTFATGVSSERGSVPRFGETVVT